MKRTYFVAAALLTFCLSASANADVLYTNGSLNVACDKWGINNGSQIADSFTLAQDANVTGVNFVAGLLTSFDTPRSVQWSILGSAPTGGNFGPGATADLTTVSSGYGGIGDYTFLASFSTGGVDLAAGTYYLVLQNAVSQYGFSVDWIANYGPSSAYGNSEGNLDQDYSGSEAFQILGTATPEPATLSLLGLGLGLAGLLARRKGK